MYPLDFVGALFDHPDQNSYEELNNMNKNQQKQICVLW